MAYFTVLARCNDPGVPDNGAKFGDDYRNGRRVKFRCNPPFALVGRHVIVCENGKWSDFTPTCSREYRVLASSKGNVTVFNFFFLVPKLSS